MSLLLDNIRTTIIVVLLLFNMNGQVLRVVNPNVTFVSKGGHAIRGMAVSLQLFLKLLDLMEISHPPEAIIRAELQERNNAIVSRYKQYFLRSNEKLSRICRTGGRAITTICRVAVGIAKSGVPAKVLHFLGDKYM